MLKRFEWQIDCGHFSNSIWDKSTPEFEKVNVVFGGEWHRKQFLVAAFNSERFIEGDNDCDRDSVYLLENSR